MEIELTKILNEIRPIEILNLLAGICTIVGAYLFLGTGAGLLALGLVLYAYSENKAAFNDELMGDSGVPA